MRSFDRGKTWEDVSKGIDYLDIHHISSAPAGMGAVSGGRSADPNQRGRGDILVSRNQGNTWDRLPLELPAERVLWVASDL